jgi:multicomponent Na+:H+ antiporter subunit A
LTSVTSYLLIGFDKHRAAARRAAMQALVVTGSGGLAMLAGLLMLGSIAGTFSISGMIESREMMLESPRLTPAMILVLAGCFTKSAQFPFHFWLPNAMEAPTPVSSFLHSATMVKAGVYLIARLNPVFAGGHGYWETALVAFGGFTAVLAGVLALRQYALKKLLAYSTTASLSLMIMAIGLGSEAGAVAAMSFLLAHALYKCCLFQTAGNITHGTGEKDVKRLGGLRSAMPMVAVGGLLGGLGMMGLPPFMGYLGKETVIAAAWKWPGIAVATTVAAMFAGAVFVMIGGATAVLPFFGPRRETSHEPHDAPPSLWLGPVVLGGLGLILGAAVFLGDPASSLLIGPAASSVRGTTVTAHLSFWHGIDYVPMWLDVAVLIVGVLLLSQRKAIESAFSRGDSILALGPDRWYDGLIAGLRGFAGGLTRRLQDGSLSWYLGVIMVFAIGVVGWGISRGIPEFADIATDADAGLPAPHEFITGLCITLGCYVMVRTRSRLSAIGGLGLVGYGVALMFVFFGAPDLAITQFLIETLSVLLLVLVFWKLPSFRRFSSPGARLRDGIIATAFGTMMAALVLIAAQGEIGNRDAQNYYAATSYEEAHGRNVVNVILVDFRGIDTMGEITVLTIAALGVFALVKLPGAARRRDGDDAEATGGPEETSA